MGCLQKHLGLTEADTAAINLYRISSLFEAIDGANLTVGLRFSSRLWSDRLVSQSDESGQRQPLLGRHERRLDDLEDGFLERHDFGAKLGGHAANRPGSSLFRVPEERVR